MRDLAAMGGTTSLREWLSVLDTQSAAIAEAGHQIEDLQARLDEGDRLTELLGAAERRSAEVPELKRRIADLELALEDERRAAAAARKEADQLDRMLMYGRRMLWFIRPLIEPLRRLRRKLPRLTVPSSPLDGTRRGRFAQLPRRIYLTYKYRGISSVLFRSLIFPLRLTPLDRVLRLGPGPGSEAVAARRWYKRNGRPVTIVIPSYRDAKLVTQLVAKIRQTTDRDRVRILVADDASGPEHLAVLDQIEGIEVVAGEHNAGFATNVNRGLRAADPRHDVILLNSDVVPMRDWLASPPVRGHAQPEHRDRRRQAALSRQPNPVRGNDPQPGRTGVVRSPVPVQAGRLGADRNRWTDACGDRCVHVHHARKPSIAWDFSTRRTGWGMRTSTTACVRGRLVTRCSTRRPRGCTTTSRSPAGPPFGERERKSQRVFWRRWETFFGERPVMNDDGKLRIVYVTQDTNVFGGVRVVFEHLNGLIERGHEVELWTLGSEPDWFELRCPVRTFPDYGALVAALTPLQAIKVATWWKTATPVWRASVVNGLPVYLVQDIETSYYPDVADAPPRGTEYLSARVQIPHHVVLESDPSGRAGLGVDA